jgi:hypothetical protein
MGGIASMRGRLECALRHAEACWRRPSEGQVLLLQDLPRSGSRLLLLLCVRRWRRILLVIADDALARAHVDYGALLAANCQCNRAKRHDVSPREIRARPGRRASVAWYAPRSGGGRTRGCFRALVLMPDRQGVRGESCKDASMQDVTRSGPTWGTRSSVRPLLPHVSSRRCSRDCAWAVAARPVPRQRESEQRSCCRPGVAWQVRHQRHQWRSGTDCWVRAPETRSKRPQMGTCIESAPAGMALQRS